MMMMTFRVSSKFTLVEERIAWAGREFVFGYLDGIHFFEWSIGFIEGSSCAATWTGLASLIREANY